MPKRFKPICYHCATFAVSQLFQDDRGKLEECFAEALQDYYGDLIPSDTEIEDSDSEEEAAKEAAAAAPPPAKRQCVVIPLESDSETEQEESAQIQSA